MFPARGSSFERVMRFDGALQGERTLESFWLQREVLLRVLAEVVDERGGGVRIVQGFEVSRIVFGERVCEVFGTVGEGGEEVVFEAALVLACDGVHSVVRKACVAGGERGVVRCCGGKGFRVDRWESAATALCVKTVRLLAVPRFVADGEGVVGPEVIAALHGDAAGREVREVCNMWLLPIGVDVSGGRIGTIVRGRERALWEGRTVDDMVEMFRRNFPQIPDVRAVIGEDELERFAGRRGSKFPTIQRYRSLVGLVGGDADPVGEAGVALPGA
jgi:hypothetical protein